MDIHSHKGFFDGFKLSIGFVLQNFFKIDQEHIVSHITTLNDVDNTIPEADVFNLLSLAHVVIFVCKA